MNNGNDLAIILLHRQRLVINVVLLLHCKYANSEALRQQELCLLRIRRVRLIVHQNARWRIVIFHGDHEENWAQLIAAAVRDDLGGFRVVALICKCEFKGNMHAFGAASVPG